MGKVIVVRLEQIRAIESDGVTQLRYRVRKER
jgi:hypothetical protein